jgi:hypothetical protein
MEIQPLTLEALLDWLRKQAAERQTSFIIQARIALSPQGTRLLDVQPVGPLETIRF